MSHTDTNVQPQGNPWDQNEGEEGKPFILPNPLRPFLEALAVDLLAGMATLNWQPNNLHAKGEVAAMKRALARSLEHSYGVRYLDAFRMVDESAKTAIGDTKIGPDWEAGKERRVAGLMDLLFRDVS